MLQFKVIRIINGEEIYIGGPIAWKAARNAFKTSRLNYKKVNSRRKSTETDTFIPEKESYLPTLMMEQTTVVSEQIK